MEFNKTNKQITFTLNRYALSAALPDEIKCESSEGK